MTHQRINSVRTVEVARR